MESYKYNGITLRIAKICLKRIEVSKQNDRVNSPKKPKNTGDKSCTEIYKPRRQDNGDLPIRKFNVEQSNINEKQKKKEGNLVKSKVQNTKELKKVDNTEEIDKTEANDNEESKPKELSLMDVTQYEI
jgi:uncharacterized membrane-anchored protein